MESSECDGELDPPPPKSIRIDPGDAVSAIKIYKSGDICDSAFVHVMEAIKITG